MKKTILILLLVLSSGALFSQNSLNEDARARIGTYVKLNPAIFDVQLHSTEARAAADVINTSFTTYFVVPNITFSNITDATEAAELKRLVSDLNKLIENPPSWEKLVSMQTQLKNTPPSAPIFAGEESAKKFYNSGSDGKNRNLDGKNAIPVNSSTSHEKAPEIPIKK
ncbi:MAG TPA: hypothetical protein PKI01_10920 [Bacteroidales bacterium]|nr:hypothetical protein [Bacteroidales bacterium]